jgi:hypothetical protein
MSTQKYLLLQRSETGGTTEPPSPARMQEMYGAFNAWKEKFKAEIVDMGSRLKGGGKVLTAAGVKDGPFVEMKEIVGGYMIVATDSYERALEIAGECPGLIRPGSSCEVREIVTP